MIINEKKSSKKPEQSRKRKYKGTNFILNYYIELSGRASPAFTTKKRKINLKSESSYEYIKISNQ